MTKHSGTNTNVVVIASDNVTIVRRTALLGLVSWFETVKTDHLGKDLYIETKEKLGNIYLNGKKL